MTEKEIIIIMYFFLNRAVLSNTEQDGDKHENVLV